MRVIVGKERPHPGAQLRFTNADGLRVTAFATNTARGQLADLELRHRRRARCEDRIRNAKEHRPDQPAAARPEPEQVLVRHHQPGLRAHRLAADAHPGRPPGPPVETQAAAALLRRRPARSLRPPGRAAPQPSRALDRPPPAHNRHSAEAARARQLTQPPRPNDSTAPARGPDAP